MNGLIHQLIRRFVWLGVLVLAGCSPRLQEARKPGDFLFSFWNVENFYDDEDDPKNNDEMENWFGRNPDMFRLKVEHLAEVILSMNEGSGPDILALCEVESERSLEALRDEINKRLEAKNQGDRKYQHILFIPDHTGREFAPGIITRCSVIQDKTHKFAKNPNGRNLEAHLTANGAELVVLVAHWTSRVERKNNSHSATPANEQRRMSYARACYGRMHAILAANQEADLILCGDFNDTSSDPALKEGLHTVADPADCVLSSDEPRPLDLLAAWDAHKDPPGSIYGKGQWSLFDHICVSAGMLDEKGWSCNPASVKVFASNFMKRSGKRSHGEPFRFGNPNTRDRGYSDHFPVQVMISTHGAK